MLTPAASCLSVSRSGVLMVVCGACELELVRCQCLGFTITHSALCSVVNMFFCGWIFTTLLAGHWLLTFYLCSTTTLSYSHFLSQCQRVFILTSAGLHLVMLPEFWLWTLICLCWTSARFCWEKHTVWSDNCTENLPEQEDLGLFPSKLWFDFGEPTTTFCEKSYGAAEYRFFTLMWTKWTKLEGHARKSLQ